jgi:fumarate reductase flavoprotein subunit
MGASARSESRGAHFRTDFPLRNDREWLNRTLARWQQGASAPDLTYEPVGLLDLPPGHRGYGSDERIEMQESIVEYNDAVADGQTREGRLASVEAIGSRLRESQGEAR